MASEISSTLYATRRKELLALVNQLRAVGAQNELDLPRITVIGNQSAGKSSVVEAISGINVPRDAGTCTRCPMECRLSSSPGPWSCRISIRCEYDEESERLDEVFETPFGGVITDKSEVEIALRRAQFAVLNSHVPHSKILSLSAEELRDQSSKSVPFSQNVVCIDLEGPELTDLSFIDLPGLIQNAEPEVVQLVENMVISHIKGNCIILVTVPMTDDIENQKALRLARNEDPDGRRTIGVLTKPDMLGSGAVKMMNLWLEVVEGRRHPLAHGYYCTRQPDDEARSEGVTQAQAREMETAFFRDNAPWSRSTHKRHFGTNNLVSTLSSLLLQIINDTLPRIRQDANTRLDTCRTELSSMPKAIDEEPATYLLKMITSFSNMIRQYVQGGQHTTKLIHEHRDSYRALKLAIRRTAPNFVPSVAKDPRQAEYLARLAEEEGEEDGETPELSTEKPFNLTQMRLHIERSVTRELVGNVPFDAKASLIVDFQKTWKDEVKACFKNVEHSTETLLMERISKDFARFDLLRGYLKSCTHELVSRHRDTCEQFLAAILEWERMPFTQNNHYYQVSSEKWLAKYKAIRSGKDSETDGPGHSQKPPAPTPFASGGLFGSKTSSAPTNTFSLKFSSATSTSAFSPTPKSFSTEAPSTKSNFSTNTTATSPATSTTAPTKIFGSSSFTSLKSSASTKSSSAATMTSSPFSLGQSPATETSSSLSSPFGAKGSETSGCRDDFPKFGTKGPETSSDRDDFYSFGAKGPENPFKSPDPAPAPPSMTPPPVAVPMSQSSPLLSFEEDSKVILSLLKKHNIDIASAEELLGKLTPTDEYEQELRVMAEVRGYFQVAYKRIIDNVPSCIDLMFVRALDKALQPFLISKFGMGTASASERCATYLSEDPMLVTRRTELHARSKMLESVKKQLDDFGFQSENETSH